MSSSGPLFSMVLFLIELFFYFFFFYSVRQLTSPNKLLQSAKKELNHMKIHMFAIIYYICLHFLSFVDISRATDSLNNSQSLTVNETLISSGNQFRLGFFKFSSKFYLGISYNNIPNQTIVWIANRENPLSDASGAIHIANDGNLILVDRTERIIWSTRIKNLSSRTTFVQLLDTGNLVLRDGKGEGDVLWQSFDQPSHAMIAGMKIGWDLRKGLNRNLTSWKSSDDPSPGEYTFGIELRGLPQAAIWKGSSKHFRSGPWNRKSLGGNSYDRNIPFASETIVNSEEVYYKFSLNNDSLVMLDLSYLGVGRYLLWDNSISNWREILEFPPDSCATYEACGPNSICTVRDAQQNCTCDTGYTPKNSRQWGARIWSGGCTRTYPLNCSAGEGFTKVPGVKLPDLLQFRLYTSISQEECRAECLKNCSCTAYANLNLDITQPGHGCLLWFEELIDVRRLSNTGDQTLYIRAAASDLEPEPELRKRKHLAVILVPVTASVLVLSAVLFLIWKRKSKQKGRVLGSQQTDKENHELPCFDIATIARATQNFSDTNKIGEGGFGPVYKGVLPNGQEIAVKRLSENSDQGLNEYKTEVMLIAKLQHRNLVRLLGWSIQGQERMLIYEYMPNGSLDSYINGGSSYGKKHLLVWRRRFSIILGIARGVLYLHRDSRLRIIHRDLKASNVLLDSEMNPKISDFGMARTFGEEQLVTITKRVVGTFGYIAPEYTIRGIFSMKSDVFSFGVLVLEIVSGQRINQFHHEDNDDTLLGHAWKLWIDGRASELVDPFMEDSYPISEVLRCIQIGLLCVQERPKDRPMMSIVILMLDSETTTLPQPNRPGFSTQKGLYYENDHLSSGRAWTMNEITDTIIEGR